MDMRVCEGCAKEIPANVMHIQRTESKDCIEPVVLAFCNPDCEWSFDQSQKVSEWDFLMHLTDLPNALR